MKQIVVAYDQNHGIGANNDLLWQRDLPADLRHFKALTTGQAIIMGRKTFESIGQALPNRQNIVLSRHKFIADNAVVVASLNEAFAAVEPGREAIVIGGEQIFTSALSLVDRIYATEVKANFPQASVFFPEIDKSKWQEISRQRQTADERNKYDFDFVVYDKLN